MEKATISQLKNRLSAYLRKVRAGESVLILDRNEAIARLDRVDPDNPADDRLTRLERSGSLRRSREALSLDVLADAVPAAQCRVLDALVEDRREGR